MLRDILNVLEKKKKITVTWKHTNRDSCQQQTWITSLEDKVLCWSCQISPPAEDKSNKYNRAAAHCWETISSIHSSLPPSDCGSTHFNTFLYLKKDRVRKPVTVDSCWWNVTSGELKGFNTLKGLVFLHIIPEARKSTELTNGHHLRSDRRRISWTSGTVNVTVAHQWTAINGPPKHKSILMCLLSSSERKQAGLHISQLWGHKGLNPPPLSLAPGGLSSFKPLEDNCLDL